MLEAQDVKYEEFKIISQDGSNAVDAYSGKFRVTSFNYYETIPRLTLLEMLLL